MQINFHFSPKDEKLLLKYIFERAGYFVAYNNSNSDYYETFFSKLPDLTQGKYLYLHLYRMDYAPVEVPSSLDVSTKLKYRNQHNYSKLIPSSEILDYKGFKSEYITFIRCITKDGKLHWGRLWMNGIDDDAMKFYRNICSYIRKISHKIDQWEWIGNHVDAYISENDLQLGQHFGL